MGVCTYPAGGDGTGRKGRGGKVAMVVHVSSAGGRQAGLSGLPIDLPTAMD